MIALVRYFVVQGKPKLLFLVSGGLALLVFVRPIIGENDTLLWLFIAYTGFLPIVCAMRFTDAEFAFALPFKRTDIFLARIVAIGALFLLVWLPLAMAFVAGVGSASILNNAVLMINLASCVLAFLSLSLCLWGLPVTGRYLVRGLPMVGFIVLFGLCYYGLMFPLEWNETFWPMATLLLIGGALTPVGRRRASRFELLPQADVAGPPKAGDIQAAQQAVTRIGLIDRLPPYWRFMIRSAWLRWWYLLGLAWVCMLVVMGIAMQLSPGDSPSPVWLFQLMIFGMFFAPLQWHQLESLFSLPYSRDRLFRSIVLPWMAAVLVCLTVILWIAPGMVVERYYLAQGGSVEMLPRRMLAIAGKEGPRITVSKGALRSGGPDGSALMPEDVARLVADDIRLQYGVEVDPRELVTRRSGGADWTIDSAAMTASLEQAVRGAVWLVGLLCLASALLGMSMTLPNYQASGARARIRGSVYILVFLAFALWMILPVIGMDSAVSVPKTFLVAHFWPMAIGLALVCVIFWRGAERNFRDFEAKQGTFGRGLGSSNV